MTFLKRIGCVVWWIINTLTREDPPSRHLKPFSERFTNYAPRRING